MLLNGGCSPEHQLSGLATKLARGFPMQGLLADESDVRISLLSIDSVPARGSQNLLR